MFGKGNRGGDGASSSYSSGARRTGFSVIGPDMVITGNVKAQADLHVEGRIEGDIDCGNLVQGPGSLVQGQVRADSARIAGTIEGSVTVRQLTVEKGARIVGDVEYDSLTIETGAQIDGRMKHAADDGGPPATPPAITVVDISGGQAGG